MPCAKTLHALRYTLSSSIVAIAIALAIALNAFHPELSAAGLIPFTVHSLSCLGGRITINFIFNQEIGES